MLCYHLVFQKKNDSSEEIESIQSAELNHRNTLAVSLLMQDRTLFEMIRLISPIVDIYALFLANSPKWSLRDAFTEI